MTKQELIDTGLRLRKRRRQLHLTRKEFALLADISPGYYSQIEAGSSQMSIDTLIRISHTSRLSMEQILLGPLPEPGNQTPLQFLLSNRSPRELELAEQVLRLFLLRDDL